MTMRPFETGLVGFLLAASLVLTSCGDDGTEADAGDVQQDTAQDATLDEGTEVEPHDWEPALFRFIQFNITMPTGIGPILNGLMNLEIRNGRLHILLETMDFAAETGATTFTMRASSGTKNEDETFQIVGDPAPFSAEIDASGAFHNTSAGSLSIPVTFYIDPVCQDGPCPEGACRNNDDCEAGFICGDDPDGQCEKVIQIPLHELTVEGTITWDEYGDQVLPGMLLNGVILKTDADTIQFNLGANLVTLTEVLGVDYMDYPEEGTKTGWWMSAEVNAKEVPAAPSTE